MRCKNEKHSAANISHIPSTYTSSSRLVDLSQGSLVVTEGSTLDKAEPSEYQRRPFRGRPVE
jgi:hypothetical protein